MNETFMDVVIYTKQHAADMLTKKHNFTITMTDLKFRAWPQTFKGTNPHEAGGNAMTTHTVIGWYNSFHGDGILYCAGKYRYVKKFKSMMKW